MSVSPKLFAAIAKALFLERGLGTRLCLQLRGFIRFSFFPEILSPKLFGDSRATFTQTLLY